MSITIFLFSISESPGNDFDDPEEEEGPLANDIPMLLDQDGEPVDYLGLALSHQQFPFSLVRKKSMPQRRSLHFSHNYNTPDDFRRGFESKDFAPDILQGTVPWNSQTIDVILSNSIWLNR